jgi:hypothetical protein
VNQKFLISIFSMGFALAACSDISDASIELSGLNYTDVGISIFSVDGYSGAGIYPNGGGGSFVCCVTIPRKWHPGMKVTVRWTADERVPELWKERIVAVPEYTEQDIGAFVAHFYPDDSVKVLVTVKIEGHPTYPYPRPKKL